MRPCQDERLLNREIHGLIDRALAALPADHRSAFVLKLLHQLSYEEISAITGSSVSKLKTDLHRARHEMRRRLASLFETSVHGMEERS